MSLKAPTELPVRTRFAAGVGGVVSGLSKGLGRGGGSVVGGRAILALDPKALDRLAAGRQVVLVSGTNGKTTTTRFVHAALSTRGPVVTNALGANLPPGLAAALAAGEGATAVLEVDEAWLGRVLEATRPAVVALLNLSRDQLDRNNEVRRLSAAWRAALSGRPKPALVANADDPLVAWAAGAAERVTWVGAGQPWTADAAGCPACGGRISFSAGEDPLAAGWRCLACGFCRPELEVWVEEAGRGLPEAVAAGRWRVPLELALPGRANLANAATALAVATCLGVGPEEAAAAMKAVADVGGRYRTVSVGGVRARLLLAKNPAGWLEVLDILRPPPLPVVVAINARVADGRDPSWLWDVPFERLRGRLVAAAGERSRDLAVRLRYAGVEYLREPDPLRALGALGAPEVEVVANYTAFQGILATLERRR